jgi:hypothetical protein
MTEDELDQLFSETPSPAQQDQGRVVAQDLVAKMKLDKPLMDDIRPRATPPVLSTTNASQLATASKDPVSFEEEIPPYSEPQARPEVELVKKNRFEFRRKKEEGEGDDEALPSIFTKRIIFMILALVVLLGIAGYMLYVRYGKKADNATTPIVVSASSNAPTAQSSREPVASVSPSVSPSSGSEKWIWQAAVAEPASTKVFADSSPLAPFKVYVVAKGSSSGSRYLVVSEKDPASSVVAEVSGGKTVIYMKHATGKIVSETPTVSEGGSLDPSSVLSELAPAPSGSRSTGWAQVGAAGVVLADDGKSVGDAVAVTTKKLDDSAEGAWFEVRSAENEDYAAVSLRLVRPSRQSYDYVLAGELSSAATPKFTLTAGGTNTAPYSSYVTSCHGGPANLIAKQATRDNVTKIGATPGAQGVFTVQSPASQLLTKLVRAAVQSGATLSVEKAYGDNTFILAQDIAGRFIVFVKTDKLPAKFCAQ